MNQPGLLSRLPMLDAKTGEIRAVIETPKGSKNKYDYDDEVLSLENF